MKNTVKKEVKKPMKKTMKKPKTMKKTMKKTKTMKKAMEKTWYDAKSCVQAALDNLRFILDSGDADPDVFPVAAELLVALKLLKQGKLRGMAGSRVADVPRWAGRYARH